MSPQEQIAVVVTIGLLIATTAMIFIGLPELPGDAGRIPTGLGGSDRRW